MKISLEKGKIKENEWENENSLSKLINICINIENNIDDINSIYSGIDSYKAQKDFEFELHPKRDEINQILVFIKAFGNVDVIDNNKFDEINQNNIEPNIN